MVALLQVVKGHHHHHHQDLSGCPEVFLALLPQPLQAFFFSCVCLYFFSFSLYRLCHLIILFLLLLLLTFLLLLLHLCLQEGALYTRLCRCPPAHGWCQRSIGPILPLLTLADLPLPGIGISGGGAGSIGTSPSVAASAGSASSGSWALFLCCC